MNGNLVAGQTLADSAVIVLDAVARKNRGERARYYRRGEEYGIINTGQQRDTDVLFDEAKEIMGGKWISGENILNKMNTRENNFFTRLYQGSDDVWKIVSWEMETL
jgi:phosphatidylserine decarboxylase